jgi:hypothetical protein
MQRHAIALRILVFLPLGEFRAFIRGIDRSDRMTVSYVFSID